MYPQVVQKEDLYTGYIDMHRIIQLVTQALDSDKSKNSIIQRNKQAKDTNPNKQEATSWIAYNLQEWPRIWTKDNQLKKNQLVDWNPGLPEVKGLSHWPFRQGAIWKCLNFSRKQKKFL